MSSEEMRKSTEADLTSSGGGHSKHSESHKPADNCDKNKTNKSSSESQGACYCGKDRNLNIVELLCASCARWFHESCISYQLGKLVPFMTNYLFICKNCSPTGLETFKKNQAPFPQMCLTAIANLRQESAKEGSHKLLFSKDREIIPFIDQYWEAMTTMPRRVTQSWYATVQRALAKDAAALFTSAEDAARGALFGLAEPPASIRPNYEAMIKQGQLKVTDMGVATIPLAGSVKGRAHKRRAPGPAEAAPARRRAAEPGPRLPAHGYPSEHPFNKDGYRYILAEPDPHAPFRQEFDESNEWSGKPIPGWLYRALCGPAVLLALHDRAPQLRVADDRLAATGERGYCLLRATHGVARGTWYWEATVEELPAGAAARLGWARRYANLQAPLGYDRFGYSWRSRKGTRFHESRGRRYGAPYGEGDTLGFLITLPPAPPAPDSPDTPDADRTPNSYKDRPLVKFKSHLYYEDKDEVAASLAALRPLPGSRVEFFRNGVSQGVAFADVFRGTYYPALSLHRSATVSVNFGPVFKHPPPADSRARPMSEKAEEAICEQTLADMLYLAENEGKLRLDHYSL